jgi:hypothetical protein
MGIAAEHLIQARLIAKGCVISQPSITTGYDLMCDWDGVINRLQCRSTISIQKGEGNRRSYYRLKTGGRIGNYTVLVAYIIPKDALYFIPWDIVKQSHTISITTKGKCKYDKYKENYEILKTTH